MSENFRIEIIEINEIEGLKIINTTPHPINFLSEKTGKEYQVKPCGFVLNATPEEQVVAETPVTLVKTGFKASQEGLEFIENILEDVIIIGSIIAAQAYPGDVFAMTPAKGFERVAPAEKRMNLFKYAIFW